MQANDNIRSIDEYREKADREKDEREDGLPEQGEGDHIIQAETEQGLTLWLLLCETGKFLEGVPLYAASEKDALEQARQWIDEQQATRSVSFYDLRHFPGGLNLALSTLPGRV